MAVLLKTQIAKLHWLADRMLAQKSVNASPRKLRSALLSPAWRDSLGAEEGQLKRANASFPKNDWWCFFSPFIQEADQMFNLT